MRVPREHAELVLAELLELAPAGVEEADVGADLIEYAVYGAPGELPGLPALRALVGGALVEISTSEVADDWQERWRRFHSPVLIEPPALAAGVPAGVPALHVRPPWEGPSAPRDHEVLEIVIDPGQAFGTGAHASTRMCLEQLLALSALEPPAGPLLDVGTGSGVLAIAAAKLGFEPVLGLDNELESVHAARENARVNGVQLEIRRFDLRARELPWPRLSAAQQGGLVVTANLLRPLLLELAASIRSSPSHLIAGGLLTGEADEIAEAFRTRLGMREHERRISGEWAALWLARSDQPAPGNSVAAHTIAR